MMGWLKRPARPGEAAGRHHALQDLDPTVKLLRGAALEATRSRIPQMAAALSYRTIFGMIPIIALSLVVLSKVITEDDLNRFVRAAIDTLGLRGIVADQSAGEAVLQRSEDTQALMGPVLPTDLQAGSLDGWIARMVDRLRAINFAAISVVGVMILMYSAISMIVEIERAFNQIYQVPRGRSWTRRLTNYTTLLVYAPVCLALTFWVGQRLDPWVRAVQESPNFTVPVAMVAVLGYVAQVLVTTGLLLVLYTVVPNTRVRFLPALGGAVGAAVSFELLKQGFIRYVDLSAKVSYAQLYGSLALIPLFLLWVYLTWAIILFGLQFTYQLQYGRLKKAAVPLPEGGPTVVEPTAGLLVMTAAARGFASGAPQTFKTLAAGTGLSEPVVAMVATRLADRGLLHRVEHDVSRSEETWYAVSRPPGAIRVAEVLEIGFELAGGSEAHQTVQRLRRAQIEAAGDETLADAAGMKPDGSSKDVYAVAAGVRAVPVGPRQTGVNGAGTGGAPAAGSNGAGAGAGKGGERGAEPGSASRPATL